MGDGLVDDPLPQSDARGDVRRARAHCRRALRRRPRDAAGPADPAVSTPDGSSSGTAHAITNRSRMSGPPRWRAPAPAAAEGSVPRETRPPGSREPGPHPCDGASLPPEQPRGERWRSEAPCDTGRREGPTKGLVTCRSRRASARGRPPASAQGPVSTQGARSWSRSGRTGRDSGAAPRQAPTAWVPVSSQPCASATPASRAGPVAAGRPRPGGASRRWRGLAVRVDAHAAWRRESTVTRPGGACSPYRTGPRRLAGARALGPGARFHVEPRVPALADASACAVALVHDRDASLEIGAAAAFATCSTWNAALRCSVRATCRPAGTTRPGRHRGPRRCGRGCRGDDGRLARDLAMGAVRETADSTPARAGLQADTVCRDDPRFRRSPDESATTSRPAASCADAIGLVTPRRPTRGIETDSQHPMRALPVRCGPAVHRANVPADPAGA